MGYRPPGDEPGARRIRGRRLDRSPASSQDFVHHREAETATCGIRWLGRKTAIEDEAEMVYVDARSAVCHSELDDSCGMVSSEVHADPGRRGPPGGSVDGVVDEIADHRDELRSGQDGCPEHVVHSKPQLHAALTRLSDLAEQ